MKLTLPILSVALAQLPDAAAAWSCGGRPSYGLMRPMVIPSRSLLLRQKSLMNRAFTQTSPRYEITDTDEKFQIAVDVPGVDVSDIDVSLDDGQVLSISGTREATNFKSRFSQTFSLDPAVDVDKITANLKNGVLIVSAPKDLKRIEQNIRKIPVMHFEEKVVDAVEQVSHEGDKGSETGETVAVKDPESVGPDETASHEDETEDAENID